MSLNLQPSGPNQSGVCVLVVSLSPSSAWEWGGVLVPAELRRGLCHFVLYVPGGGTWTVYCFLTAFALFLQSLTSLVIA